MSHNNGRPDLALQKGLPANLDAERFLIASILINGERISEIAGTLKHDDFALESHRRIYTRLLEIAERGDRIGRVELAEELMRHNELQSVGGLTGLLAMEEGLPIIRDLSSYVRLVKDKATLRQIIHAAQHLTNRALLAEENPSEILAGAEQILSAIGKTSGASASIADLPAVGESQATVRYIREPELPVGAVIGLTGDSGSGKSTIATAWARDAIAAGRPVLILDRENPRDVAGGRMARLGLSDGPLLRWAGGWNGSDAPLPDARAVIEWVSSCNPKPLVVIDSLVAFMAGGDENSASEMRAFLHRARRLADLGATVATLHHDGKADSARDFRGSSDFKAAVDQAFHCTNISSDARLDRIRLRCFKSRYGFCGEIVYHYAGGRMFRDERSHAAERTAADQLGALLRVNPGVTTQRFEDLAAGLALGRNKAREFLNDGVLEGSISRTKTGNKYHHYFPGEEPDVE